MKKFRAAPLGIFLFPLLSLSTAHAAEGDKNLRGRLGVGFTNQVATTNGERLPAVDAKYYLSRNFATALGLGFNTRRGDSAFALGVKGYENVFYEPNLIFYVGGGLAYVNNKGNRLAPSLFLGSEFFLPGLPSLGFTFEAGVSGDSSSGSFAIRTTGDSFLTAGMHFYF